MSAKAGLAEDTGLVSRAVLEMKELSFGFDNQRRAQSTAPTPTPKAAGMNHFTQELSFLSETDKDWVMGRAIVRQLKWT
jgi:hypothetical protein